MNADKVTNEGEKGEGFQALSLFILRRQEDEANGTWTRLP